MESKHTTSYVSEKVDLLERLAMPFGIKVRSADTDYWSSAITVANAVDDLVDKDRVSNLIPFIDEIRAGNEVKYLKKADATRFSEIYHNLTPERQDRLERGSRIAEYAIRQSQSENIDDYIFLKMAESSVFSDFLKIDVDQLDHGARSKFNLWLPSFGKAFYAIDTFKDMKEDYENKNTIIEPTLPVMSKLGAVALYRTIDCFAPAPIGTKKTLLTAF